MLRRICLLVTAMILVFSLSFSVMAGLEAPEITGEEAVEISAAGGESEEGESADAEVVEGESADAEVAEGESADAEVADGESAEGESAEGESDGESGESSPEQQAAMEQEMLKKWGGENYDLTSYTPIEQTTPDNDIHTDLQYSCIMDDFMNVYAYGQGKEENTVPKGIICDFSADEGIEDASEYIIQKSSSEDFSDAVTVTGLTEKTYTFNNLMLGEHFYWRAGTSEETIKNSPVHEVTTGDIGPRNCVIDGVVNVRDIGGYDSSLVPGGKIKQGLLYRGAALNTITDLGIQQLTEELGVKAEIDVRDEDDCTDPYVDGVDYYACPIPSETESTRFEEFSSTYVKIFDVISQADEKPVLLHCTHGADRTGISVFMLLMVLGASYEDAARDYLFTNLTNQGPRFVDGELDKWYHKLDYFAGETKAEQAKNWLIFKGVPAETVEHIREIFVEEYTAQ